MVNLNGAWLRFIDADKITLAFLPWDPFVGIAGAFFGDAHATGRAATWEIQFPDGRRARGVSGAGNIFPDETLRVELRTVEDWMGELSSSIEPAPEMPPSADFDVWVGDRRFVVSPIRHVLAALGLTHDVGKPLPPADLSPLANLATAVAWGLALERVVTEWRAWHPAARVSWDVHGDDIRFAFSVEGLGVTLQDSVWMGADLVQMTGVLFEAQRSAALAMAPHYVAPAPKPENRDAALRRFADEMRAAKAADRGAA